MKKLLPLVALAALVVYLVGARLGFSLRAIVVLGWAPIVAGGFAWLWWFRNIYFFRDPERLAPGEEDVIVSPADGRVMYVYRVRAGAVVADKQGQKISIDELARTGLREAAGWLVGIYMTPFDVHFSRAPIAGEITTLHHHRTGMNLPMVDLWEYVNFALFRRAVNLFAARFHFENERMTMRIGNGKLTCFVILIADRFVNKITTYFREAQNVIKGDKIAFIQRGSQTDLFIAAEGVRFVVGPGSQVYAGTSVIARIEPPSSSGDA
jgi:phosphatidylserine decarboxylase